jgi:hypothetical protein
MRALRTRLTPTVVGAVIICGLGAGAANAATEPDWTVIEQKPSAHTYYSEELGQTITIEGTLTVSVPSEQEGTQARAMAAGCTRTTFAGNPRKVRQSTAPYANVVVNNGYLTLSSGCPTREYASLNLREDQGIYKPTVDRSSGHAYPGGTKYYEVSYVCGSATHGYFSESGQLYQHGISTTVRLCP